MRSLIPHTICSPLATSRRKDYVSNNHKSSHQTYRHSRARNTHHTSLDVSARIFQKYIFPISLLIFSFNRSDTDAYASTRRSNWKSIMSIGSNGRHSPADKCTLFKPTITTCCWWRIQSSTVNPSTDAKTTFSTITRGDTSWTRIAGHAEVHPSRTPMPLWTSPTWVETSIKKKFPLFHSSFSCSIEPVRGSSHSLRNPQPNVNRFPTPMPTGSGPPVSMAGAIQPTRAPGASNPRPRKKPQTDRQKSKEKFSYGMRRTKHLLKKIHVANEEIAHEVFAKIKKVIDKVKGRNKNNAQPQLPAVPSKRIQTTFSHSFTNYLLFSYFQMTKQDLIKTLRNYSQST